MLLVGPTILLLMGLLNVNSAAGLVATALAAVVLVVIAFFSGVRISADESAVAFSLSPFWRKKVLWSDVADVAIEEVRPFEDFGGWGIKGSHKRHGILLSAGDTTAVKVTLKDGRRYLVAVGDKAHVVLASLNTLAPHGKWVDDRHSE